MPPTALTLIASGLSGGDGASSHSVLSLVSKVLGFSVIAVAGFFVWWVFTTYVGGGKGKGDGRFAPGGGRHGDHAPPTSRNLLNEAVAFMVVEGLLGSLWLLAHYGSWLAHQVIG